MVHNGCMRFAQSLSRVHSFHMPLRLRRNDSSADACRPHRRTQSARSRRRAIRIRRATSRQGSCRRSRASGRQRRQLYPGADACACARTRRSRSTARWDGRRVHDELGGQQVLSGHRARPRHVRHARPERSRQADRDHEPSCTLHAQGRGVCSQKLCARNGGTVYRGCGWAGPPAVRRSGRIDRGTQAAADRGDFYR